MECRTYENVPRTREKMYIKPKNEVFARHLLASCKQEASQTLHQFLQNLKLLAKNCDFKSVTANQNQTDAIRDTLISGMQSNSIGQRLLEKGTLDLDDAYEQARSLEMACPQSWPFIRLNPHILRLIKMNSENFIPKHPNRQ